ncbi:MAG TPA: TonB-dependent receptor [Caldithrix abyssi]|uniref:TonB-dependent receptor n=1 Tax=Caldithrix abyssi TaxID=187145 RepID=A0A7V4TY82_CALAY|nr:TonB-dependent receptor [Caldithrix abyssi]
MKAKLFISLIFLLLTVHSLFAIGEGKIVGQVLDKESGDPLPGCNIVVEGTLLGASADEDGFFIILNVPPGTYNVSAQMVGYVTDMRENVKVLSNRTIKLNFELSVQAIEGEAITVEAYKNPLVQKDLTYKIQAVTAEEIENLPVTTMTDVLVQQAGISRNIRNMPVSSGPAFGQFSTVPTDNLHFRGGRENEALYLFDGVNVTDRLWGGFSLDPIGEYTLSSLEAYTGTFGAKYGGAMSGVVNIAAYDQIAKLPKIKLQAYTDNLGIKEVSQNTNSYELFASVAIPGVRNLGLTIAHRFYSTDGYIYGYIYPEWVNSEGRDKSGEPEKVPMQYQDTQFTFGKLVWKPSSNFSATIGGFVTKTNQGLYDHYFKYNPYGAPRVNLDGHLLYGKFNYVFNKSSYIWITAAQYERGFLSRVWDNPDYYLVIPQTGTAEFSISGEDWVYFNTNFKRLEARADYFNQLSKVHSLTAGFDYNKLNTDLQRRNPDGFGVLEMYHYEPVEMNGYISDKMEFEDMGMIVNVGLRFDYIDPKRKVLKNLAELSQPDASMEEAKPVMFITPRLGISFPIMETAAMWFGYGHYYQYPDYFKVFQGTFYAQGTGQYRPNPQLENTPIADTKIEPEETVNYEVGIQSKITPELAFNVTGFYRKTSNLIGVLLSETNEGKRFQVMGNIDYATVKGLEVTLRKNFSSNFSFVLNYTLSQTLVSTSILFERPIDEALTFPANWDQPHQLNGVLNFHWNNGWGFSLYGYLASGTPYTRTSFDPNGERNPSISTVDLNVFKDLNFFGFKQQIFLQVYNLFNKINVWWVYSDSGIPGKDANPATSDDYTNNPSMYGPGRTIRLGIKIWN